MKRSAGLILWALAVGLGAAEDGGQALAFSKLAVGARPAALGRATGAVGGDAYGFVENPALVATLEDLHFGSQWASLPSGRSQQYLAFGRPVEPGSSTAYGLGYHRSAMDKPIEKRRANTPDPDSSFGEAANIFYATYAGWLWPQSLAVGMNMKVLGQNLGEASSGGFAGDLGLLYRPYPGLFFGLAFQDVASKLTWNTGYTENVPLVTKASAAWSPWEGRALLCLGLEKSAVQELRSRLGIEWWALPRALALRAGWAQGQWSTGAGLRTGGFGWATIFGLAADAGLDYAFAADPLGDGAFQHRVSLDIRFNLAGS